MNSYQIKAKLNKGKISMGACYMVLAHNMQSACAKAKNYWKDQGCTSKVEIIEIKKTDGTLRVNLK